MKQILALCDGASPTREITQRDWEPQTVRLAHRGSQAKVNLNIDSPDSKLLTPVADRSADLLRVASYAYAVDQAVSPGW